jgi:hypothetical protein
LVSCGVTLDEIKNNDLIQSVLTSAVGAAFPGIDAKPRR